MMTGTETANSTVVARTAAPESAAELQDIIDKGKVARDIFLREAGSVPCRQDICPHVPDADPSQSQVPTQTPDHVAHLVRRQVRYVSYLQ